MAAGRINPWLKNQAEALPAMLSHDFSGDATTPYYLQRVAGWCRATGASLTIAYVPFCGVVHPRYASSLIKMGMSQAVADALATDPAYRGQAAMLARVCPSLGMPLADTTEALARAEADGTPQFWDYDTHPRPAGYATIAGAIHEVWRRSFDAGPSPEARTP
jgi:hypothetical protein